jgi:competence ComEA-like helix-hairpin-helix protein
MIHAMALLRPFGRRDDPAGDHEREPDARPLSDSSLRAIPEDWLPPEILQQSSSRGQDAADGPSVREWLPRGLPASAPDAPQRRRRSSVHDIPLATQPADRAAADALALHDLQRERDRLQREHELMRRSLAELRGQLAASRPQPSPAAIAPSAPRRLAPGDRVNLNSADVDELVLLPGVGRRAAERIVEYREQHGPFASVQALIKVEGFHADRVKRFLDHVCV